MLGGEGATGTVVAGGTGKDEDCTAAAVVDRNVAGPELGGYPMTLRMELVTKMSQNGR